LPGGNWSARARAVVTAGGHSALTGATAGVCGLRETNRFHATADYSHFAHLACARSPGLKTMHLGFGYSQIARDRQSLPGAAQNMGGGGRALEDNRESRQAVCHSEAQAGHRLRPGSMLPGIDDPVRGAQQIGPLAVERESARGGGNHGAARDRRPRCHTGSLDRSRTRREKLPQASADFFQARQSLLTAFSMSLAATSSQFGLRRLRWRRTVFCAAPLPR